MRVADQEAAGAATSGDVVLVKGSRCRTWDAADWLRESTTEPSRGEAVAR